MSLTLPGVSEQAAAAIRAAIEARGPIPFSEFMELALYGPGGFYEQPPVGGEGGHFVTSPHVHPVFGKLLAGAIAEAWRHLGSPRPLHVVEIGAGDGTLAAQLLGELHGEVPIEYVAIERSPGAREKLRDLPGVRVEASLEVLPQGLTGFVVANELLDNVPFERIRRTKDGCMQVCVDFREDSFVEVDIPCDPELEAIFPRPERDDVRVVPRYKRKVNREFPVSEGALAVIDRVGRLLRLGYALFIDYGDATGSAAHGYRAHRVVRDVLADPGSADITAGVAFDPLVMRAERWGLEILGPMSQSHALRGLGIEGWIESERLKQVASIDKRAGRAALKAYDARQRATQLIDPDGLGALQWLWLATPGCGWWKGIEELS